MLNRSMPSTAGATISIPTARAIYGMFQREVPSLDVEHNLQCSREVYQMESGFLRYKGNQIKRSPAPCISSRRPSNPMCVISWPTLVFRAGPRPCLQPSVWGSFSLSHERGSRNLNRRRNSTPFRNDNGWLLSCMTRSPRPSTASVWGPDCPGSPR